MSIISAAAVAGAGAAGTRGDNDAIQDNAEL